MPVYKLETNEEPSFFALWQIFFSPTEHPRILQKALFGVFFRNNFCHYIKTQKVSPKKIAEFADEISSLYSRKEELNADVLSLITGATHSLDTKRKMAEHHELY